MQELRWGRDAGGLSCTSLQRSLPEDLRQVASGEAVLADAFLALARYQDEQARTAADLLERETWALTRILAASAPIWKHLASPTLRFVPDCPDEPVPYHLELGHFSHLAALLAPSAAEQTLIAAQTPCWARVYPHQERLRAGQSGALACSYVPITEAEAVAMLGLGRILAQVEAATGAAGEIVLAQARAQMERQERLLGVERMLGWEPDPVAAPVDQVPAARTRLVVSLLKPGSYVQVTLGSAFLGFVVVLICVLIGIAQAIIWLVAAAVCLLVWRRMGAP
ncbi:MAG: hypothetical protein ACRDG4_14135 [Chloroflexota bacterium]